MESRVFWEDIPFGLCILKSIAAMLKQQTPAIDTMIEWHQRWMKKEYLRGDKTLNKEIVAETVSVFSKNQF